MDGVNWIYSFNSGEDKKYAEKRERKCTENKWRKNVINSHWKKQKTKWKYYTPAEAFHFLLVHTKTTKWIIYLFIDHVTYMCTMIENGVDYDESIIRCDRMNYEISTYM